MGGRVGHAACARRPDACGRSSINSILFTVQLALVYVAFTYTSASHGALITNLQPFMLLFLAHFFLAGDRITVLKLAGLVLGCAGAVCVFMDRQGASGAVMLGDLLLLAATAVWAGSAAYTKHLVRSISSVQIVFYQMLFSIPLFALAAPVLDAPMVGRVDLGVVVAIGFQVLLTTAFAFVAWTRLMQVHGAVALHAFVFLIPVSGRAFRGADPGGADHGDDARRARADRGRDPGRANGAAPRGRGTQARGGSGHEERRPSRPTCCCC